MNSKLDFSRHKKLSAELQLEMQDFAVRVGMWKTCLNCIEWDKASEGCGKFRAVPPPHIIVSGCPDHDDDIPF